MSSLELSEKVEWEMEFWAEGNCALDRTFAQAQGPSTCVPSTKQVGLALPMVIKILKRM